MKTCPECHEELVPALTRQGVEVNICPKCEGIWLDRDEIFHFTKIPTYVRAKLNEALDKKFLSARKSPVTDEQMYEIPMFDGDVHIDYCQGSGGLWLDKGELERFPVEKCRIEIDKGISKSSDSSEEYQQFQSGNFPELLPLPNLAVSSASVLIGMYAVLSLVLITASLYVGLSAGLALIIGLIIVAFQFLLGPFFMDLTLRWLYKIQWVKPLGLPTYLEEFVAEVCRQKRIKFPRFGILQDGAPQAFTYGHHPNNGRIVISQGLLDLLGEEEAKAVVAHEIGHMVHWDMLVMTAAQVVPLVLYYIYRTLIRIRTDGKDKTAAQRYAIAIGAYILYIISEYIVLWFSRIREYYADRFAGEVTGEPNYLASALVKIGYGLAGRDPDQGDDKPKDRSDATRGIKALGIFDEDQAKTLAISSGQGTGSMGGEIDKESLKAVARWDLWNPWAAYFELHSTHPLIAKRVRCLSNQSMSMGKEPYVHFNEQKPESFWDEFLVDITIYLLPTIVVVGWLLFLLAGFTSFLWEDTLTGQSYFNFVPIGVLFLFLGTAQFIKVFYSYPSNQFAPMNILALLKKVRVSAVNPVPCRIKGKIIGRGVPGLIYSEDFVLQEETGIIFLDYQQPFAIWNFFFGLLRAKKYQNEEVEIMGWYRRAPIPYIEIKEMKVGDKISSCYVYQMKIFGAIITTVLGLGLLFI